MISSTFVCMPACSSLSSFKTSSKKLVASRIMFLCRNRSATALGSIGGGFCFPI